MGGSRFNFSDAEKDTHRRVILQYAAIAQGSALVALLAIATIRRLWRWYTRSTASKNDNLRGSNQSSTWDRVKWWLGDDAYFMAMETCRPDEWILGIIWFSWLFFLSSIGKINEPFSLARLPQDLRAFQWFRLLTLPDAKAFHLSNRFALIAASQWPFLPLLRMKRSSPLARLLGCPHTRLGRYRTVLSAVMFILLLLHMMVQLGGLDTQMLHSRSGQLRIVGYGCLYLVLSVTQKLSARKPIWGLVALTPLLVFVWLVWGHAVSARGYMLQSLVVFIVTLVLPVKTRAVLMTHPSPEAQAIAQAAIKPPGDGQDGQPPFIILRSGERTDLSARDKEDITTEKKRIIVATIRTTNGWLVRHLAWFWKIISLTLGTNARNDSNQPQDITLEYATAPTSTSEEETRVSLRFEGPPNPLGKEMDDLTLFNAEQVLFIAGGMPGYLAYPACFTYIAAQRKKRDTCSARVVWTVNSKSGTSCAIPRRLQESIAFQDDGDGDAVVLCPDTELLNDHEGESTATVQRRGVAKNSCSLTGPCSHAGVCELIDRLMRRNPSDSVAVVVLGPNELEREARTAMRPWVMRGRKVWWLFENFGM